MKLMIKICLVIKYMFFAAVMLIHSTIFAATPSITSILETINKKNTSITSISKLSLWKQTDEWHIYQGVAILSATEKSYRDFYIYIKPEAPIESLKIRLHNFTSFPFPVNSYTDYINIKRNPETISHAILPILGNSTSGKEFTTTLLNCLTMDFGQNTDQKSLFATEKERFEQIKETYLPQLDQVRQWNEKNQRFEKGLLTTSKSNPIMQYPEFQEYRRSLERVGIDFMLPFVVDSSCKNCFSLVGSFSPNNNYSGFFWIDDETLLPKLDPDNVFYLEPLGDGWYIFQST